MDPYKAQLTQMHDALLAAKRVLVIGDGKPDGDSMGASTALYNWLKREGKNAALFMSVATPKNFLFLDGVRDFTIDPAVFDENYDVVVSLDASDTGAGGFKDLMPCLKSGHLFVNVDHHVTNTKFGHLNIVITDASSTCEIVYRFFETNRIPLDDRMATSIMTGLLTDTSHFSNPATNPKAMAAAGACAAAGARHTDILKHLVKNKSVASLRLWGLALARLQFDPEFDMTMTYFKASDLEGIPGADESVQGISNFLNAVGADSDAFMVLRETSEGTVKGSIRSISRDISKLAQALGGGGHKKAAGFMIKGRIEEKGGRARIVAV
ncbi:DHH family phosphoesterase [Patescibacteria group bacterium]|jgi:phosphoesterase RecJ-like protein|nr:DHH family phosphoesterase [Patescibacteria group bacterium]